MEFSMDQPSILATLRADYLLFLIQRLGMARRGEAPNYSGRLTRRRHLCLVMLLHYLILVGHILSDDQSTTRSLLPRVGLPMHGSQYQPELTRISQLS